ncbi:MAG: preprotein translocase subunit SecA [Rubrobacteridae bacterium]|nr:preprotein translocase subunit SecA [Rubrobacteridae bacterium]
MNLLEKVLRFGEGKKLKQLEDKVTLINAWEEETAKLTDSELKAKTDEFKQRLKDEETLDDILPEAFAVVREASKRVLNMRHFDVQLMGGIVLHEGKIAEMRTGEGKTLVATLPVYLNSLTGKGVHVVTVNDYLAKRDSEWMGQIYTFLGLSVGLIQSDMPQDERFKAYRADVTYGTNNEFGFDYLRDNMVSDAEHMCQQGHYFAIVDEVDSILIDEARTPLIISGAPEKSADTYYTFAKIVPKLKKGEHYEVDEKHRTVSITEEGVAKVEESLNIGNMYDDVNSQLVNHLQQALKAQALFKKDVDYIVKDGEVIIVDEFTGRLMDGRRYSEGLHQAIEAKEGVRIREENQTLATITFQNYFRMYEKLAGMTGTAATEADEFNHIYKLETVIIPPNRPVSREDMPDQIYKTVDLKFKAVVDDIAERYELGQPILVGTVSIENSERLAGLLKRRGIKHEVLNAKHHEREAEIIAQAGKKSAVTIATNMAGRGVDIILGGNPQDENEAAEVLDAGGLHVIGTESHASRRIDNQLRGRSGRQGDPGSTQFYLSLEDDLMRLFGSQRIGSVMERLGVPDDQPIEHSMINKSIETAQKQVESQNFAVRKHVLEYDDVINKQREVIYAERRRVLHGEDLKEEVQEMIETVMNNLVAMYTADSQFPEEWDWDGLFNSVGEMFSLGWGKETIDFSKISQEELVERLVEAGRARYAEREKEFGEEIMRDIERFVMLEVIDNKWREHLYEIDYLKEGIGLRAIGQRDPLIEYKSEGYDMFQGMIESIKEDVLRYVYHVQVVQEEPVQRPAQEVVLSSGGSEQAPKKPVVNDDHIGRNDPCPCGSGKKYKKCCGK